MNSVVHTLDLFKLFFSPLILHMFALQSGNTRRAPPVVNFIPVEAAGLKPRLCSLIDKICGLCCQDSEFTSQWERLLESLPLIFKWISLYFQCFIFRIPQCLKNLLFKTHKPGCYSSCCLQKWCVYLGQDLAWGSPPSDCAQIKENTFVKAASSQ